MPEQIENRMVVDSEWEYIEQEYNSPDKFRMKREKRIYEEMERVEEE